MQPPSAPSQAAPAAEAAAAAAGAVQARAAEGSAAGAVAADERARSRARLVLWLVGAATALVMGGLVALALLGPEGPDGPRSVANGGAAGGSPVLGGAPLPVGCLPDPANPPRLEADLSTSAGIDFGAVRQGQVIHRDVVVRSVGRGPLCVRHLETGCGCVKAEIKGEQRRFEPGESFVVVVTLDSAGRSGPQKKAFSIVTNELETSRHTWPVTADISLGVIVSSNVLDFGRPRRGAPAEAKVRLSSPKTDPAWTVTDLVAARLPGQEPPAYAWEATEVADPHLRVLDLTVKHPGRSADGMWQAPVVVKTSHADRPELHLTAVLTIMPPVQATPPAAMFGFVRAGTPDPQQRIMLRAVAGLKFRVTGVRVEPVAGKQFGPDGPGFAIEQGTTEDGIPFVGVRYDGNTRRPGLIEAVLIVSTDVAEQPEVRVPLKATATAGR